MKLGRRLAIYFALGSSAVLIASRLATLESFRQVQEYDLDRGLRLRAEQEGTEVALVGRRALEAAYQARDDEPDPLEQLVTYGALYRADGSLSADTQSFAHAPSLEQLGIDVSSNRWPRGCFDFRFRNSTMRGVLVEVKGTSAERQFLLLAASRRDMDSDALQLWRVGWWVNIAAIPVTLAIGWWFGRRTTRGITSLASSARRVAAGELDVPFDPAGSGDEEVRALGAAIREMVARLKTLLDTERRFAAHAAHELRTPLTVLRGELELALRRQRTSTEYETFLRDALDDTKRLTHLAEDLLVVARAGSDVTAPMTSSSLMDLVDEALAASKARASDAPKFEVEGVAGIVRGARADLVRMIRNLIDNAVDHGDESRPVRIVATKSDDDTFFEIAIENEGPGITEDDRALVFEHFHRGADARAISGAGLGLGIAREIVVRHGGTLTLDSPAHPTRFVVRLPAAADGAEPPPAT